MRSTIVEHDEGDIGLSNDQLRLRFSNASIGFETGNPLIKDVNLTINSGEIVGLIGRSGIGKTTLLRTAAGLLSPLSGSVECCCDLTMNAKRGSIALIPQRLGLIQHQSVGYNVLMGALPGAKYLQTVLSLPSREIQEATKDAIRAVGLSDKVFESVNRLSGGQQRRVAIARAMVQNPRLILADECLGELDAETAKEIIELLRSLAKEKDIAIFIVDHNPLRARTFCDRLLQLRGNSLLEFDNLHERHSLPQAGDN